MVIMIASAISNFVLCLIPLAQKTVEEPNSTLIYIIASLFWMGWVVLALCIVLIRKTLKPILAIMIEKKLVVRQKYPGIISFTFDKPHIALYAAIAIGLLLIITDILIGYVPENVMFPVLAVTVMLIVLHSVIDGTYYKVYRLLKENVKNDANNAK